MLLIFYCCGRGNFFPVCHSQLLALVPVRIVYVGKGPNWKIPYQNYANLPYGTPVMKLVRQATFWKLSGVSIMIIIKTIDQNRRRKKRKKKSKIKQNKNNQREKHRASFPHPS